MRELNRLNGQYSKWRQNVEKIVTQVRKRNNLENTEKILLESLTTKKRKVISVKF